MAMKDSQQQH